MQSHERNDSGSGSRYAWPLFLPCLCTPSMSVLIAVLSEPSEICSEWTVWPLYWVHHFERECVSVVRSLFATAPVLRIFLLSAYSLIIEFCYFSESNAPFYARTSTTLQPIDDPWRLSLMCPCCLCLSRCSSFRSFASQDCDSSKLSIFSGYRLSYLFIN